QCPSSPLFPYTTLFRSIRRRWTARIPPRAPPAALPPRNDFKPPRAKKRCRFEALDCLSGNAGRSTELLSRERLFLSTSFGIDRGDRKSTRLNSSHVAIS